MSNETTDHAARIAEIEARLEAATPGPWEWSGNELDQTEHPYSEVIGTDVSCGAYCLGGQWSPGITAGNRTFIANAPDDLRYLLTRVRECERDHRRFMGNLSATLGVSLEMGTDEALEEVVSLRAKHRTEISLRAKAEAERDELRQMVDLCAQNTAAADLAQEVEFLRTERDAALAELARLKEQQP